MGPQFPGWRATKWDISAICSTSQAAASIAEVTWPKAASSSANTKSNRSARFKKAFFNRPGSSLGFKLSSFSRTPPSAITRTTRSRSPSPQGYWSRGTATSTLRPLAGIALARQMTARMRNRLTKGDPLIDPRTSKAIVSWTPNSSHKFLTNLVARKPEIASCLFR